MLQKRGIAQKCLCETTKYQAGASHPKVSRDNIMGHRSDSIAISRNMGPLWGAARPVVQSQKGGSAIVFSQDLFYCRAALLSPCSCGAPNDHTRSTLCVCPLLLQRPAGSRISFLARHHDHEAWAKPPTIPLLLWICPWKPSPAQIIMTDENLHNNPRQDSFVTPPPQRKNYENNSPRIFWCNFGGRLR